jgi:hypothetical protein
MSAHPAVIRAARRGRNAILLAGFGLLLAGCGYNQGDRAVSGGLIGAGAGAVIGSVTGIGPAGGAVLGGAVGAIGGAATSPRDLNLGRPIWHED